MDAITTIGMEAAVANDDDARERLARLFELHHRRLYRFALRMTRGDGEAVDLVQEAFVRAARDQRRLPDDDAHAGAWLVRVVVNLLRDRGRREAVRRAYRLEHQPDPPRDFSHSLDTASAVRAAVATLPPRQRAVIVLHELEERSVADVAAELGLTAVTVRWHLSAARKRLARLLAPISGDSR